MAKHEFGIMKQPPQKGLRYDAYEPEKYNCISVDDDLIELLDPKLTHMHAYWHSLDVPGKGLAYCGITLIPPESLADVLRACAETDGLQALELLLQQAQKEEKFVIHYGL